MTDKQSDTPRTEAFDQQNAQTILNKILNNKQNIAAPVADAYGALFDFARTLERELNETKAELQKWHNYFFGIGGQGTPEKANEDHCFFIAEVSRQAERAKEWRECAQLLATAIQSPQMLNVLKLHQSLQTKHPIE